MDRCQISLAKARCGFHQSSKPDLQINRRTADVLQHLSGRCLLPKRFDEIGGALAEVAEKPRVLDGDDGLGGKVLQQRNLRVAKRPNLLAVDEKAANQLVLLKHGNAKQRPGASVDRKLRSVEPRWSVKKARFREHIGDVGRRLSPGEPAKDGSRRRTC